jgi:hypothetical protein
MSLKTQTAIITVVKLLLLALVIFILVSVVRFAILATKIFGLLWALAGLGIFFALLALSIWSIYSGIKAFTKKD